MGMKMPGRRPNHVIAETQIILLEMAFDDESEKLYFCTHCALIEGAMKVRFNVQLQRKG